MKKKKNYFKSWYFKQMLGENTIVFIPGMRCLDGEKEAFIEVIINNKSTYVSYSIDQFLVKKDELYIQIGGNIFSKRGIKVYLQNEDLMIDGVIRFGKFNSIHYSLMGPFSIAPGIECSHDIISMDHALYGSLQIGTKTYHANGGRGYIESHHGKSLPANYIWTQYNGFKRPFTSIMAEVADVVCYNLLFQGIAAVILYKGKEYRFATYLGAKVRTCTKNKIIISQNNMILKILFHGDKVRYYVKVNNRVLIDEVTKNASYECRMDANHFLP